jgi:hypothetical protein
MRTTVFALLCMAAALGGCATSPATNYGAPSSGGLASPSSGAPAALPPNAFGPEPNHDFGTGGP